LKKQNNKTVLANSRLNKIQDDKINLESESPNLPLKESSWGVIWFDEFYDEEVYGDITFALSPEYLNLLLLTSLNYTKGKEIFFSDGETTYVKTTATIEVKEIESLEELNKPYYITDESETWIIECHFEGSNYFSNGALMKNIIKSLGGSKLILEKMTESLKEYEGIKNIEKCEFEYLDNVYLKLKEIECE
jgi:hypothetical protein